MVKVLLLGVDNPVGYALLVRAKLRGITVISKETADIDFSSYKETEKIINSESVTAVIDLLHFFSAQMEGVVTGAHVRSLKNLVRCCDKNNKSFFYLTGNQVFEGKEGVFYNENAKPNSTSRYGKSLFKLEQIVRKRFKSHFILRSDTIFGPRGWNILTEFIQEAQEYHKLRCNEDQFFCPTPVDDVARVLIAALEQQSCGSEAWGTYHYCGAGKTSSYEFAELLLAATGQFCDLSTATVSLTTEPLKKSVSSAGLLSCNKIRQDYGIKQLSWRQDIAQYAKDLFAV